MRIPRKKTLIRALMAAAFAVGVMGSSGCAIGLGKSLHEYSMLDYQDVSKHPKQRAITAQGDRHIILGLTFDTDYVDSAYRTLLAQCPRGEIANVRTRYSTDLGIFAYRNKVKLDGICLE